MSVEFNGFGRKESIILAFTFWNVCVFADYFLLCAMVGHSKVRYLR